MSVKLCVVGAGGRMGRRIVALGRESGRFEIVGAVERKDYPEMGKDAGILAGVGEIGVAVSNKWPSAAEVVIDFSSAAVVGQTVQFCVAKQAALVLGTTGLSGEQRLEVESAGSAVAVIYGTNMSVGMNVLFSLVGKVAAMLGEEYDIEIVEQHHRFKKDAPSGTALTLAEKICAQTGRAFPDCLVQGREGPASQRQKGTIGMHSVRAGDITGVHSVIFGAPGETVTLHHRAGTRDNFVRGALRAAQWLVGREPGVYSMADCLGLSRP